MMVIFETNGSLKLLHFAREVRSEFNGNSLDEKKTKETREKKEKLLCFWSALHDTVKYVFMQLQYVQKE